MGVPRIFNFLADRYPCMSTHKDEYQKNPVDFLYIDFNYLIHNFTHGNSHDALTLGEAKEKIQMMLTFIDSIISCFSPQRCIYFGVDASAPFAKINQQRSRRFRCNVDGGIKESCEEKEDEELFDPNCISPGTEFMNFVQEEVLKHIKDNFELSKFNADTKVYFSGHKVPGEGEHKIMDFFRYTKMMPDFDPSWTHALLSPDADALFLGLSSHIENFYVVRDISKSPKSAHISHFKYVWVDISSLRQYIFTEIIRLNGFDEKSLEETINDFILLLIMIGNDFVGGLPNFHVHSGSVSVLLNTYVQVRRQFSQDEPFLISKNGMINNHNLSLLFENLIDYENQIILGALKPYEDFFHEYSEPELSLNFDDSIEGDKSEKEDQKVDNEIEENNKENNSIISNPYNSAISSTKACKSVKKQNKKPTKEDLKNEEAVVLSKDNVYADFAMGNNYNSKCDETQIKNFKAFYYKKKADIESEDDVNDLCKNYLESLQWVINYYLTGKTAWHWCFKYHYPPFLSDILKVLKDFKYEVEADQPISIEHQLVAIMPKQSMHFCNEPYSKLYKEKSLEFSNYFPEELKFDINGKLADWEAINLLPILPFKVLHDAIEHAKKNSDYFESEHEQILCFTKSNHEFSLHRTFLSDNALGVCEETYEWDAFRSQNYSFYELISLNQENIQNNHIFVDCNKFSLFPIKSQRKSRFYTQFNKFYDCILYKMESKDDFCSDLEINMNQLVLQKCNYNWPFFKTGLFNSLISRNHGQNINWKSFFSEFDKSCHSRGIIYAKTSYFTVIYPAVCYAECFGQEFLFYGMQTEIEHPILLDFDNTNAKVPKQIESDLVKFLKCKNGSFKLFEKKNAKTLSSVSMPIFDTFKIFSKHCWWNYHFVSATKICAKFDIEAFKFKILVGLNKLRVNSDNEAGFFEVDFGLNLNCQDHPEIVNLNTAINQLEYTQSMAAVLSSIYSKHQAQIDEICSLVMQKESIDKGLVRTIRKIQSLLVLKIERVISNSSKFVHCSLLSEIQNVPNIVFWCTTTENEEIDFDDTLIPLIYDDRTYEIAFSQKHLQAQPKLDLFDHVFFTTNFDQYKVGQVGIVIKIHSNDRNNDLFESKTIDLLCLVKKRLIKVEGVPSELLIPYNKYSVSEALDYQREVFQSHVSHSNSASRIAHNNENDRHSTPRNKNSLSHSRYEKPPHIQPRNYSDANSQQANSRKQKPIIVEPKNYSDAKNKSKNSHDKLNQKHKSYSEIDDIWNIFDDQSSKTASENNVAPQLKVKKSTQNFEKPKPKSKTSSKKHKETSSQNSSKLSVIKKETEHVEIEPDSLKKKSKEKQITRSKFATSGSIALQPKAHKKVSIDIDSTKNNEIESLFSKLTVEVEGKELLNDKDKPAAKTTKNKGTKKTNSKRNDRISIPISEFFLKK